jgi:hypothetical protein
MWFVFMVTRPQIPSGLEFDPDEDEAIMDCFLLEEVSVWRGRLLGGSICP